MASTSPRRTRQSEILIILLGRGNSSADLRCGYDTLLHHATRPVIRGLSPSRVAHVPSPAERPPLAATLSGQQDAFYFQKAMILVLISDCGIHQALLCVLKEFPSGLVLGVPAVECPKHKVLWRLGL